MCPVDVPKLNVEIDNNGPCFENAKIGVETVSKMPIQSTKQSPTTKEIDSMEIG